MDLNQGVSHQCWREAEKEILVVDVLPERAENSWWHHHMAGPGVTHHRSREAVKEIFVVLELPEHAENTWWHDHVAGPGHVLRAVF